MNRFRFLPPLCLVISSLPALAIGEPQEEALPVLPQVEIVSARHRDEIAQNLPISLLLSKGETLERSLTYQAQELPGLFSGLNANFMHARESSLSIRGIGNNSANEGLQSSTGLYLDNVYLGRPGQLAFDLLDIDQIELLRGPQGTLFGKNTTAGVLHVKTREPVFRDEAELKTSIANRGYRQTQTVINHPFSDTLALRVSAYATHDDGWLKNLKDGKSLDEINRDGVRVQLLHRPDSGTRLRAIFEHHEEDSSTGTMVPYAFGPWNKGAASGNLPTGVTGSNATNYATWTRSLGGSIPGDPNQYQVSLDGSQRAKSAQNAASLEISHSLGGHTLTSITAWRDWHFTPSNDMDNTSLYGVNGGTQTDEWQFSQELRLASPLSNTLDYVVGGYYLHQYTRGRNAFTSGPYAFALNSAPNNSSFSGYGLMTLDSFAAFGQITRHLSDTTDLNLGLRLNREMQTGRVHQNGASTFFPSPLFQVYDSGEMADTENTLSAQLGLSHHVSDYFMTFANWSFGSKSGGYNLNGVVSPGAVLGTQALRVRPEKAQNIEIGFKSSSHDDRFRLNATLFHSRVSDYQAATNTTWSNMYIAYLSNVGDVTARGLEAEGRWHAHDWFDWRFNLTYLDARFTQGSAPTPFETFTGPGGTASSGYGAGTSSLAGKQVNGAPRWTLALGLHGEKAWTSLPLTQYWDVYYAWRASTYGDINNSEYARIPAYGLWNLSTGWRGKLADHGVDISLWVKNLFDKHYFLALQSAQNAYFASAGQPRTIGMSLKLAF